MKTIIITRYICFLILFLLSFCKDSNTIKKEEQRKNLVTIFAYQKSVSETAPLTCSDANVSSRIVESINKYSQGCNQDSDCMATSDYHIKKYFNWGKSCYICIGQTYAILTSQFETFKNDLATLNANSCQGIQDMSSCGKDGCPSSEASCTVPKCSEKKCKIACVPYY